MNSKRPYIIMIGLAILGLLFFWGLYTSGKDRVNWRQSFKEDSKHPYGTFLLHEMLDLCSPTDSLYLMNDSIGHYLEQVDSNANYFFIGHQLFMDSTSNAALINFVDRGNTAFISSKVSTYQILDTLLQASCFEEEWYYHGYEDSIAYFDFDHPNLAFEDTVYQFKYERDFAAEYYNWPYIPYYVFCEEAPTLVDLGTMNDTLVNFFKLEYGKGTFYFHTNPILFTNHALQSIQGKDYALKAFAYLAKGDIYIDSYSGLYQPDMNWWNSKRTFESEGPLQYILAQPSLAWAWYIALSLGLLYLIFRAKREQRIIPVLEENRNTSLAFIETIGRMYFIQQNHRKIALQKIHLWKGWIRSRYQLATSQLDTNFVEALSSKSEFPKATIEKILTISNNIEKSNFLSENSLIDFHQLLDEFYKNAK